MPLDPRRNANLNRKVDLHLYDWRIILTALVAMSRDASAEQKKDVELIKKCIASQTRIDAHDAAIERLLQPVESTQQLFSESESGVAPDSR